MGKASTSNAATPETKRKKKKGRPSKNALRLSSSPKPIICYTRSRKRRSTRQKSNCFYSTLRQVFEDEDDDDDERKEKKVKLVERLPQSDGNRKKQTRKKTRRDDSGSGSDQDSEDRKGHGKKCNINAVHRRSDGAASLQENNVAGSAATPHHGSPQELGPPTPLPDKKLLVFILDRLQKKDVYGVYSDPVDPSELPDYLDIIKQPMDFATVRKKLDEGAYKYLEELEADVLLICSNALQYNSPGSIFYRQAQTMQELAKRDFENLKHEGENGESRLKFVRRGRPPSNKNQKKSVERASPVNRVGPELSSRAPLAEGDKTTGSKTYNLRKGTASHRFRSSTDPHWSSYRSRNGDNYSECPTNWNDEFPASVLKADMRHGKRQLTVDENRRDAYGQFHPGSSANSSAALSSNFIGDMKRLVPVGLQDPLFYARSLARYASDLGPVAWKVASKKIEMTLPAGAQYGPGWVGEIGATSQQTLPLLSEKLISSNSPAGDSNPYKSATPWASDLSPAVAYGPSEGLIEAVGRLNSQSELSMQGNASFRNTPFPVQPKTGHQSQGSSYGGMFGYNTSAVAAGKLAVPGQQYPIMEGLMEPTHRNYPSSSHSSAFNYTMQEESTKLRSNWWTPRPGYGYPNAAGNISDLRAEAGPWSFGKLSWQAIPMQQQQQTHSFHQPDLNVRIPAQSPASSSLQIGSPQQPDLALQL